MNGYPEIRLRRLRATEGLRRMLAAPLPGPEKFIWPVFVTGGRKQRAPIAAMPGQFRFSVDELLRALEPVAAAGVGGVLLFGAPPADAKDAHGRGAWSAQGAVQRAVRAIRRTFPGLVLMTDVCLCAYTDHGHCGALDAAGAVDNDATLDLLAKVALSHADAGRFAAGPRPTMNPTDGCWQHGALPGLRHRVGRRCAHFP